MKANFKFSFPFRVRFAETDAQGIVFNGAYFTYLDSAITEYQRYLGFTWQEITRQGFDFLVASVTFEFRAPAFFDDIIHVFVRTEAIGNSSLTLGSEMYREDSDELLTLARMVHVTVKPETKKPVPVPDIYRKRVATFEGMRLP